MLSQELTKELQIIIREDHEIDLSVEDCQEFGEFLVSLGQWARDNEQVLTLPKK